MEKENKKRKEQNRLEYKVYSLGGLGVVGMNMYVIESNTEILIMDAGILFADDEQKGVNYVIPDFTPVTRPSSSTFATALL